MTLLSPLSVALALAAGAAYTDTLRGQIPNGITLPALALAPIFHGLALGPAAAATTVCAAAVSALVPYFLFRLGAAGGGDVKLLAALGAWGGASFGIETQIFGFAIGCIGSLCFLSYRGQLLRTLLRSANLVSRLFWLPSRRVPLEMNAMSTIRMGFPFLAGAILAAIARDSMFF